MQRHPTGGSPVEYVVEERRRTIYVKSSVPPDQWDEATMQSILATPDVQGNASAGTFRRTQSCTPVNMKIQEVEEGSGSNSETSASADSPNQIPAATIPMKKSARPESYAGSPMKLRKPPPFQEAASRGIHGVQARWQIYFYHKQDPHYGFTNFSAHPVNYKGKEYPTSEHLFQSFKVSARIHDQSSTSLTCQKVSGAPSAFG
jgi:diaminohydroxyphosphoribosylaminopyrimidine deaminase/5-amino-6-(5-phosphoribosylamino)uracil reductase